ncbi:MAG: TonB-dependent receptor domain-containing protein [Bacteroidota bacterium]
MFRKLILLFSMLCLSVMVNAAGQAATFQVKGTVTDSLTGKGISYVTITVQTANAVVKRLASDASGKFEIALEAPGKYDLVFHSIGYNLHKNEVELAEGKPRIDLGIIAIAPSVEKIGEVTVATTRPLVRTETDKIIYSIEADPESKTSSAIEMLRKVPMVTVDGEDNIMLKGNSNFRILLNGKNSSMLSQNPKDVLRSLPASTIRDIEVITNPSSKYEAEGVGGIINIITTRRQVDGFMGRVNTGVDTRGGYNAGLYATTKINKFGFSMNYGHNLFNQPRNLSESTRENLLSETNRYTETNGTNKYNGRFNFLMTEASYEIDTFNLVSLSFMGQMGHFTGTGETMTTDFDLNRNTTRQFRNILDMKNKNGMMSGNIDYQRTFSKPDKTLTFSYKMDYSPRNSENGNEITGLLNYMSYNQKSTNDAYGLEQTLQVDYFDPVNKTHQVETGLKYILRQNVSESDVLRLTDGEWVRDLTRINDLDYDQHIIGIYAGYLLKINKFSFKTGLRAEGTINDGYFKSVNDTAFTNKLFNLVPYVTLSQNLDKGQNLRLSYTQRLSRPGIWYLNPFYNDLDPLNVSYGNPKLDAEVSHSFDFTYGKFSPKYNVNISLTSAFANNTIQSISTMQANGVRVTTYENIGTNQRYGANMYGSLRFGTKFTLNTNMGVNYLSIESNDARNLSNSGFMYNGNLNARVVPWKNGSFSAFGGVFSSGVMLQGRSGTQYYNSVSYMQEFFDKKLTASLSVSDPFRKKMKYESTFDDPTFTQQSVNYIYNRMLRVNISYRFGQMKGEIKKARRGIKNDDLKSGGDSSGGGAAPTGGQN